MKIYLHLGLLVLLLFAACRESTPEDKQAGTEISLYDENHRPQYHFSPEANWMNDPNGMVYHEGEYHLFYQYYPDSTVWGPMHWGHAVSTDMIHWKHLPIALYPDSLGLIFSGSAVIDQGNTSGLGENGTDPLVAIFTHHNMDLEKAGGKTYQYQSIAYSNDKGRTWKKYKGNPVLPNPGIKDFRDPKVIWHDSSQKWIMVFAAYDKAMFYSSPNLIDWTKESEFGIEGDLRLWECPDLFPLKVENSDEEKWVLITSIQREAPNGGTATSYFIGDFDGKKFTADPGKQKWLDWGKDNYAFVTWSDIPPSDGRRMGIGWMSNWQYAQVVPTDNWRSAMTLPRELILEKAENEYYLKNMPVREIDNIKGDTIEIKKGSYTEATTLATDLMDGTFMLELESNIPVTPVIIKFSNLLNEFVNIGYNPDLKKFFIDRSRSGKTSFSESFVKGLHFGEAEYEKDLLKIKVFMDHSSIELFADDGRCVMTDIFFSNEPMSKVELIMDDSPIDIKKGQIVKLNRIW